MYYGYLCFIFIVHPMTNNQEDIRKTVTDLQEHLNRYLSKEKKAMEDRIRQVFVNFVREGAWNKRVARQGGETSGKW